MGIADDLTALRAHFRANWQGTQVVLYENAPDTDVPSDAIWCRFSISAGNTEIKTLGMDYTSINFGRVYFQVIAPKQTGVKAAALVADSFAEIFRHQNVNETIVTKMPEYRQTEEDDCYVITVSVPYEAHH